MNRFLAARHSTPSRISCWFHSITSARALATGSARVVAWWYMWPGDGARFAVCGSGGSTMLTASHWNGWRARSVCRAFITGTCPRRGVHGACVLRARGGVFSLRARTAPQPGINTLRLLSPPSILPAIYTFWSITSTHSSPCTRVNCNLYYLLSLCVIRTYELLVTLFLTPLHFKAVISHLLPSMDIPSLFCGRLCRPDDRNDRTMNISGTILPPLLSSISSACILSRW